ncbi:hypothetical protein [Streptomyces prunicolor]|jgi:hypothetical protein
MGRDELVQAFHGESDAESQARSALAAGAEFEIWPSRIPASRLHRTYARRFRISQGLDRPTLGFAETVEILAVSGDRELLIGYIDDRERGGFYYQLFLIPDPVTVVGCIGLKNLS